jgi:hypothetical protein
VKALKNILCSPWCNPNKNIVIENPTKICTKVHTQSSALSENQKFFKNKKISPKSPKKIQKSRPKSQKINKNHFTPYFEI